MTMLPWLIIPLIIAWALSQLLPPGFRFEVTSPRLACVAVLLVSLGWYELAMPRLSSWRAKRSARLREKRRIEAQEAAKWRKEATRRCRNCLTAYRDQTPGGGRFMCTYCGHVSRRPVLDVPGGAPGAGVAGNISSGGNSFSLAGSAAGLVNGSAIFAGRSPKVWSGRVLPDRSSLGGGRGWMGGRPWTTEGGGWGVNGSWFGGPWPGSAGYSGTAGAGWGGTGVSFGGGIFGGEKCSVGESYSGILLCFWRVFSYMFLFVGWIWRKVWGAGSSGEDGVGGGRRAYQRRGEDAGPPPGTRSEKARRKAEEKRQARLEKEQLEAEEKKQREEVARLVEERRRQRDERLEAEKESEREAAAEREREIRREREAERRRQEKAKVQAKDKLKDQEAEDMRKKKGKENEKRGDAERYERKEDPKSPLLNGLDSGKLVKPAKGALLDTSSKGNETGVKGTASNASKWGSSKYLGSAKSGFFSRSKNVAASLNNATSFWGRSFSAGSNSAAKLGKPAVPGVSSPSTASNLSSGSSGKSVAVSGSAWNKIPWTNVWGKGTSKIQDESSKMKLGVVDGCDSRSEGNAGDDAKELANGTVVSPSVVGVPLQPIAPPSSVSNSWSNLFSSPSCFPPIDLSLESGNFQEHKHQTELGTRMHQAPMTSSLTSSQIFLGTSAPPTESCVQAPISCSSSAAVEACLSSSFLPAVSSSVNMVDFSGMDIPDPLSLVGPVSDSLATSFSMDLGPCVSPIIKSNPLSPIHAPFPAPMHTFPAIHLPAPKSSQFINTNNDQVPQILEPWGMPSFSSNDTEDNMGGGIWHNLWGAPQLPEIKLPTSSPWDDVLEKGKELLQPIPQTSSHPLLEAEPQLPSRLFSPQQRHGSSEGNHGESLCSVPIPGSNSIWLDSTALESTANIWEDPDIHHRVPPEFVDCITHLLMEDPVITADGHSYERSAIETWLKSHDTSPKTGEVLPPPPGGDGNGVDKTLRPNHILRGQIIEYKERVARGSRSQDGLNENGWHAATGMGSNSSWSMISSTALRPHIRGFYPTPGVESVWSYNMS